MEGIIYDVETGAELKRDIRPFTITQIQAGLLLGGGKRAFQKYESGDVIPSRAISNLLRLLSNNPSLLKTLPAVELT